MAVTGTSFEQVVALFTAGQEITQNASQVGNALRSISMRIRGYDEETEQLSEDLANVTGDVIDLTKVASNDYQGISLFTDETQTEYKEMGDYLKEIASIYNELDAKTGQELLEKLFGKNRAGVGAAILKNIEAYDKALDTMAGSAGSAQKEMDTASQAISYHLNELQQTWVGIAQTVFKQGAVNTFVDALTSISEALAAILSPLGLVADKISGLADIFGALPTVIGLAAAGISAFGNVGERINQFLFPIILGVEYAHKVSNGNMNDIACILVA